MKSFIKMRLHRVDAQVAVLTAIVVTVSCLSIFFFGYVITYKDMIRSLTDRVYSIYNYLDEELDKSTFVDINTKEDIEKPSYKSMKELFYDIKRTTGVQYLYTAKRDEVGRFVYVIDGLSDSAGDFRYPGDAIEPEIVKKLERALKGEAILPNNIVHTTWGEIFITYLPIHDDAGAVVGAIGIEFMAEDQYATYRLLGIISPIIILISCTISAILALIYFKRVSNPNFKDFSNTDYLTGLKNRNAYELDVKNMCALENAANTGLILADLNGLKAVNDSLGHESGDLYIKLIAEALEKAATNKEVIYRVGGDEFVVLIKNASQEWLSGFILRAQEAFKECTRERLAMASCSFGKSICTGNTQTDIEKAYQLADADMYANKNDYYISKGERRKKA